MMRGKEGNCTEQNKVTIYLCDLVHNYLGAGTYMFPLNVGYIGAYAKIFFPNDVKIKIFKYPEILLQELKSKLPDIIGFSNYTWNADINNRLSQFVKSISDKIIIIFGGPNINYTEQGIEEFFVGHAATDFYAPFQGETPFVNLLKRAFESELDIQRMKEKPIDGIYFLNNGGDVVVIGKNLERIKNPDEIPSPYLTGLMDEFFNLNLIPIIETNRGCPYQCTYCCQGISSYRQINFFSLERIQEEIDYIAARVKKTNLLSLADSNFGIVKRDFEIARYLDKLSEKTGYPHKVNTNWAKNQTEIFELAKILKNINLVISLQSLDETVLKKIKRTNISIPLFREIISRVNDSGSISGTEIILGLPGETKESHIETLKKIFEWDVSYIICYNCLLLDGSEMAFSRENGEFKCNTKYRLIDSSFGKYNGILSFEYEEGIRSTENITEEGILFFRPIHWLIQFLWNYRFYCDLLKYIRYVGVNPLDYIILLIEKVDKGPSSVKKIFDEFKEEAKNEWFDSVDELKRYYSCPEKFKLLSDGLFGKMNGKYIFKILLEVKKDFEEHLYNTAISHPLLREKKAVIRDIIDFSSALIINFEEDWGNTLNERNIYTKYNLMQWRETMYQTSFKALYKPEGFRFRLFMSPEQSKSLNKLFHQYFHINRNVTLRKMSEFMSIDDFFYKTELILNLH